MALIRLLGCGIWWHHVMSYLRFNLPNNVDAVKPCPKCGQKTQFVAKSQQVTEDGCEVWVECICGHDPHEFNERLESVMGGCDEDNIRMALDCWNDASGHNDLAQLPPLGSNSEKDVIGG